MIMSNTTYKKSLKQQANQEESSDTQTGSIFFFFFSNWNDGCFFLSCQQDLQVLSSNLLETLNGPVK